MYCGKNPTEFGDRLVYDAQNQLFKNIKQCKVNK